MRSVLFFCALAGIPLTLCSCTAKSRFTTKVGEHQVVIFRKVPLSRSGASHSSIGVADLTYEESDLKVRLENEVLTVNGKTYIIPHKDDSIEVVDGRFGIRVEINGQLAKPERGSG
jgi:hypothetical protein